MTHRPLTFLLLALIPSAIACAASVTQTAPAAQRPAAPVAVTSTSPASVNEQRVPRRPTGSLSERDMALARAAWKYFENNYQPATGFVNAVDKYPSTTMWDLASVLAATVSARELGLITPQQFDERIRKCLGSLGKLDLFRDELPNKAYNSATLQETTYTNDPGEIGYSAIDLGRLLAWLHMVRERYPQYADLIDRAVLRWNFCNAVDQWGTLYGAGVGEDKRARYLQEGRLGYEEYAAKGFALWGFDTSRARKPEPFLYTRIYGYDIPHDRRDPRDLGAHNYVVSESYVLDGIEFNWDLPEDVTSSDEVHTDEFLAMHADRIFLVQKERHRQTGTLTARSEHQLEAAPFFVYDTIYTSGAQWNTVTEAGDVVPRYAAVAAKAAVGLWALWNDPYGDLLYERVRGLIDPERGIYEGVYEDGRGPIRTLTANNNGIILETLLYRKIGKLAPNSRRPGPWEGALTSARDCETCRPRVAPNTGGVR